MPEPSLVGGNSTKAGLPSSLNEINLIISEASKDSLYSAAQERKALKLERRIGALKKQLEAALGRRSLVLRTRKQVDALVEELEREQAVQFSKSPEVCSVCVDMDAFFAAVAALDDPSLKDVPMAVGSSAMLSTANYAARKYGVSAALPGYIAMKLCPELKIVPLRYDRYRALSGQVSAILTKYDSNLVMYSLDEGFLQLKAEHFSSAPGSRPFSEVIDAMRREVRETTGLTCSVGFAVNGLLAKLASNIRKPDGQFEIDRFSVVKMREFLHAQPTRKIPGIGKVMARILAGVFDVQTVGDLFEKRHLLPLVFKEKTWSFLLSCSLGHQNESSGFDFTSESSPQSMSCERTFLPATNDLNVLYGVLKEILANLQEDVKSSELVSFGGLGIKIKNAEFETFTREKKYFSMRDELCWQDVEAVALGLLEAFLVERPMPIRLFGVRLGKLAFKTTTNPAPNPSDTVILDEWLEGGGCLDAETATDGDCNVGKCPICGRKLPDESKINAHIDECLTKVSIREAVQQDQDVKRLKDERRPTALDTFLRKPRHGRQ